MSTQATTAAVYCRISQDRSAEGLGVERQEALCRELAGRKGWPVAEVYVDNDMSAYSAKPRKAYQRMLADLEAGGRDAVIVVDTDRLTRHPRELEDFIDLADRLHIPLANVSGDMDLSSSDGRFRARIIGAVARQESEKKSDRLKREREQRATKGQPHPGPRSFGFQDGNVKHRESEAQLIRDAAKEVLAGRSLWAVADLWNELGITSARGKVWNATRMGELLVSPRLAGLRVHQGEVVGEGSWKPILDRETHEQLVALAKGRSRMGRPPTRLLSGFMQCGICERPMSSSVTNGRAIYACTKRQDRPNCGGISISRDADDFIRDAIFHRLSDSAVRAAMRAATKGTDNGVGERLVRIERKLGELHDDYYQHEVIERGDFLRQQKALRAELDRLRGQLARNTSAALVDDVGDDVAAWWKRKGTDSRRSLVQLVFIGLHCRPADRTAPRRFDGARLDPDWRY